MTYEDWIKEDGIITIHEAIDTTGFEEYYPVPKDSIKLSLKDEAIEVTVTNGFTRIPINSEMLYITHSGNLETGWLEVTDKPRIQVQIVMVRQEIAPPTQKVAPYPVMFCFTWRVDGNIEKSGLEGGGW